MMKIMVQTNIMDVEKIAMMEKELGIRDCIPEGKFSLSNNGFDIELQLECTAEQYIKMLKEVNGKK